MKKLFLIVITLYCFQLQAQSQIIDSEVVSAVIYNSGAQVTSEKKISLNTGSHTLVFEDLSPNIDESSIVLNGIEHINLNSISFETDFLNEMATSEALEELKNQHKALVKKKAYTENKVNALQKSITLLEKNQELNNKESELNVAKIKAYKEYYSSQIESLNNSIYDHSLTVSELKETIQKLAKEIQKLESENRTNRGKITLEIDVLKQVNPTLSLNYFIYDAGWYASYDLKSKGIDKDISLNYNAKIYQMSGQNWDNIDLKLSTANPISDKEKPEIEPYFLDFNREQQKLFSNQEALNEVVVESYDSAKRSKRNFQDREVVKIVEQQTSVEFVLPNKISLASQSDHKQVQLDEQQIETKYEYYAAPELSNSVFLIAELKNWQDLELISGEANLYFEDSYLGSTSLNTSSLEDNLIISLGADEKIIMERTLPDKKTSQSFFGSNTIINKAYEVKIKNTKNLPISILVQERLPISRNDAIKIENIDYSGAEYDEKKGYLNWNLEINANNTSTLNYSYSVKYPKNRKLFLRP